ncbi:cation diffusion facilitator family transporter [Sphingobium sp. AN558]|uniref:cation diffusion facilitator family transporter n=1 Tax=Sphingobium sp. AN558 TaxID=3133442 RepID=UPI0030BB5875
MAGRTGHYGAMADHCCASKGMELERLAQHAGQRRVLQLVLAINAIMFIAEFGAGIVAGSTALMADAVDMLGDAVVYGLSLFALSRSDRWKAGAALAKGVFILAVGVGILIEIAVKLRSGVPPSSSLMLLFGGIALIANLLCLRLLWRFRSLDLNMASTFECSRNDVISNVGVLVAAGLVGALGSSWPDILVGAIIAALFLRSAISVIKNALPSVQARADPA